MLRRCVVLLVVLGMLEPALACSIEETPPREIEVEVVQGLGGDCYYKRTPQPEQTVDWAREESWRTEFYLDKNATKAVFTKDSYFYNQIVCLSGESDEHISYVEQHGDEGFESENWLEFFIDGQMIASYAPIDLLQRKDNLLRGEACSDLFRRYVKDRFGLKFDETTNTYVYQVKTFDNHLFNFDLSTGKMIFTEQAISTLLMDEILNDHVNEVQKLLAQGANPNTGNIIDGTPLHLATKLNRIEIAEILLKTGAKTRAEDLSEEEAQDPDLYDYSYIPHNPIFLAASLGHLNIIKLLLDNGANINQQGNRYAGVPFVDESITALEISILNGHFDIASYLVMQGAEITSTTLELAISTGKEEMIELVSNYSNR
jgi:Ankyrin repeats (3 copies)